MLTSTGFTLIWVELYPTGNVVYSIAVKLLASVEIPWLLAEYGIDIFRRFKIICHVGYQLPGISNRRKNRHLNGMALTNHAATSRALSLEMSHFQDNKWLHEQFEDTCRSMDHELDGHGFGFPQAWYVNLAKMTSANFTSHTGALQCMFNDELGWRNGVTSYFQTNLDSTYIFIMIASFFWQNREERTVLAIIRSWH